MIKRELELSDLLRTENIDIIFLTETDTSMLISDETYTIAGYKTVVPEKMSDSELVRIVCLIKEKLLSYIKIRFDLMSSEFPSIWVDYKYEPSSKPMLLAGFCRVWTHDGKKSGQISRIKVFNSQMEKATEYKNSVIVLGDANRTDK